MKKLFIIGAGKFGREVLEWALAVPASQRDWTVAGFLDSRPGVLNGMQCSIGVVGDPLNWEPLDEHVFVCAIGDPRAKLHYAHAMEVKGGLFTRVIHPTAVIGSSAVIGPGCVVCPHAVISVNVVLGTHVAVNSQSVVAHDAVLGDGCVLSSHCDITGGVRLGKGVFLGSHASVLPHAVIGDWAVIGAGAVVLKGAGPGETWGGVPAHRISQTARRDE